VRVHAAQCLERMGPRGRAAAPALVAALAERELAPGAALALGALGHAAAEPDLRALLAAEHSMELRVAAATAVGRLALEASVPTLAALVSADEPVDLRAAAATALLACAPAGAPEARQALAVLADQLRERAVDLVGVEQALHAWLERAAPGDEASREALRAFEASAAEPPEERLRGRHQALRVLLGER
jgi:HEAT repeat protein